MLEELTVERQIFDGMTHAGRRCGFPRRGGMNSRGTLALAIPRFSIPRKAIGIGLPTWSYNWPLLTFVEINIPLNPPRQFVAGENTGGFKHQTHTRHRVSNRKIRYKITVTQETTDSKFIGVSNCSAWLKVNCAHEREPPSSGFSIRPCRL